jgi:hypothetical protein
MMKFKSFTEPDFLTQALKLFTVLGLSKEVKLLFERLVSLVKTRGWKQALAYIKDTRLAVIRYVSGCPLSSSKVIPRLTKDGIPTILGSPLITLVRERNLSIVQDILTVLRYSYLTTYRSDTDFEPIISPSTAGFETVSYKNLVQKSLQCIKELGIIIPKSEVRWSSFHMSTKMGPLGLGIVSSINEFKHPMFGWVRKYLSLLQNGINTPLYSMDELIEDKVNIDVIKDEESRDCPTLRRLAIIQAPEGKTRVVAMVDYWTQSALRPLNTYLLKQLPIWFKEHDRTNNQLGFKPSLPDLGHAYHSFDLKGFTDRFPMKYQETIVEALLGANFARAWSKLLVGMAYFYKGNNYLYRSGQPMGAYTSWTVCTLCHHLVVRVACHNVYKTYNFDKYYLLGDDIIIFDSKVASEYKRLISVLGVEINEMKTLVSADSYEFAKRLFVRGTDVTGLPWDQLFRVNNPLTVLGTFIADSARRREDPYLITKGFVRKLVNVFHNGRKSSYSAIGSIYQQSLWIHHVLGGELIKAPFQVCNGYTHQIFEDIVRWWGISRLESLIPELKRVNEELINKLDTIFATGGPRNMSCIPYIDILFRYNRDIGSWLVDLRHERNSKSIADLLTLILEGIDCINFRSPQFERRQVRVRELIAHGLRKSKFYFRTYSHELSEDYRR